MEVWELLYWTTWHDGTPVRASGLYYLPLDKRSDLPLVAFNHAKHAEELMCQTCHHELDPADDPEAFDAVITDEHLAFAVLDRMDAHEESVRPVLAATYQRLLDEQARLKKEIPDLEAELAIKSRELDSLSRTVALSPMR